MQKPDLVYLKSLRAPRGVKSKNNTPIQAARIFIDFCRVGVEVKHAYPEDRADVAYNIASMEGMNGPAVAVCPEIREILNLAYSLEIPDPHIYLGDGMTPAQGWEKLEDLVELAYKKLQSSSQ